MTAPQATQTQILEHGGERLVERGARSASGHRRYHGTIRVAECIDHAGARR